MADQHSEPTPGRISDPTGGSVGAGAATTHRRPGMLTFAAIRWLFVIPAAPVLAVVVITLCVMVVYGLAKHSDYFADA